MHLTSAGLIGMELKAVYDGSVSEKANQIGEEKLQVRTIECKPGSYVWVEMFQHPLAGVLPKPTWHCFTLTVNAKDAIQSGVKDTTTQAVINAVKQVETQEATKQLFQAIDNGNVDKTQRLLAEIMRQPWPPQ